MKNIIIMLVLALGAVSCDKGEHMVTNNPDAIESFIITNGAYSLSIDDLLLSEATIYSYNNSVLNITYSNKNKYSIEIDSDYGCPVIKNCTLNNQEIEYSEFKNLILYSYYGIN